MNIEAFSHQFLRSTCCYPDGSEEAVLKAFHILSEEGVVIDAIHEVPWSK